MNTIIVYASKYGTSKSYAKKLGELTETPVFSIFSLPIQLPEKIIFVAPIYLGQIKDLKQLLKRLLPENKLVLLLNGLFDYSKIEQCNKLEANFPSALETSDIFYLPGAVAQDELNFVDKNIIKMAKNAENILSPFPRQANFQTLESLIPKL